MSITNSPNEPKQERTLGQRRYENTWQRIQQFGHWLPNDIWAAVQIGKSGYERAEEVGSDVRALAEKVDRHLVYLRDAIDGTESRIEHRLAALERGQGTLSQSVQSLDRDHVQMGKRIEALESPGSAEASPEPYDVDGAFARLWAKFESGVRYLGKELDDKPAEAAPDPVCTVCGHSVSDHIGPVKTCVADGGDCQCWKFVPAEQAVQEPPALDPVNDVKSEIMVASVSEDWSLGTWDTNQFKGKRFVVKSGFGMFEPVDIDDLEEPIVKAITETLKRLKVRDCGSLGAMAGSSVMKAIRAYGGDAREGGK